MGPQRTARGHSGPRLLPRSLCAVPRKTSLPGPSGLRGPGLLSAPACCVTPGRPRPSERLALTLIKRKGCLAAP